MWLNCRARQRHRKFEFLKGDTVKNFAFVGGVLLTLLFLSNCAQPKCANEYKACTDVCKASHSSAPHLKLKCEASCSMSYAGCDASSFIPGLGYFMGPKEE